MGGKSTRVATKSCAPHFVSCNAKRLFPGKSNGRSVLPGGAMLESELEQLRLRLKQLEAENGRLRESFHEASVVGERSAARPSDVEGRLRAILDSATDYAIITTDDRGLVTTWNEGAWRILGWHEHEIVGR